MRTAAISILAVLLVLVSTTAVLSATPRTRVPNHAPYREYGCQGKISDEMREKILHFHNERRIKLAHGKEANKTGRLPSAKNMYKLSWDCELEKKAEVAIAVCPENLSDLQGYGTNYDKLYHCPKYPKTSEKLVMEALNKWWGEARKYGLTDSMNRYIKDDMQGSMEEWANMASGKNTKIGCSYNKIKGSTVFLCAYDNNAVKDEKVIYEAGTPCKMDEDCTTYEKSKCATTGLCVGTPEPGYKQKEEALERACNDESGMTEKLRKHLLDSYNRYRSSVARGLEPDAAGGNAPKAEQMLKMIYDCPSEKVALKLAKKCPSATRKIYSHNWNMHKASDPTMSDEAAADEATSTWWSELKTNGVGASNILTPDLFYREYTSPDGVLKPISHYLAMAKDISYKLGCVIHKCGDGKYVHCLSSPTGPQPVNKPIYQVGEPCKKDSDCKGKFVCVVEEGLCSIY